MEFNVRNRLQLTEIMWYHNEATYYEQIYRKRIYEC